MTKFKSDETFVKPLNLREVDQVKDLVSKGYEINYGRLMICNLEKVYQGYQQDRPKYQVFCDDYRLMRKNKDDELVEFNEIYSSIGQAADKFVALKNKLEAKNASRQNSQVSTMPVVS